MAWSYGHGELQSASIWVTDSRLMFIHFKNSEFISKRVTIRGLLSNGCANNTDELNRKPTTWIDAWLKMAKDGSESLD
jgi:hypothetical protein